MHTPPNKKTLQRPSTQSQSKMQLQCSNNKDEYKQSDCIKARNHTLLEFLHHSRKWYIFVHNKASR